MKPSNTADQIFKKPPQFGLRGDPHLWDELKNLFESEKISTTADFNTFLNNNIEQIIGHTLERGGTYYLEKFNSGGMSSGTVSADFWIEKGIPILIKQFIDSIN